MITGHLYQVFITQIESGGVVMSVWLPQSYMLFAAYCTLMILCSR